MKKPLIKVCGITNATDALAAANAGADYLGLIFVSASPRSVTVAAAKPIVKAVRDANAAIRLVGVFQNALFSEMQTCIEELGLDMAQLHGDESVTLCESLPVPVMKVVTVQPGMPPESLLELLEHYTPSKESNIEALLLDTPKTQDATTHAWMRVSDLLSGETIRHRLAEMPHFLAGGLTAQTVADVAERFQPDGVDVASGVEAAPGHKDHEKLAAFCRAVRQVQNAGVE